MDPSSLGLPHRPPFVFIDEVEKLEIGLQAEARKRFLGEEPFFQGHFPGNPIVPGVLLAEAMAQTAGIAIGGPGKMFLLTAIRAMKFLRPIRPQEEIHFRAKRVGEVGGLVQCAVEARVQGELVAEGQLILAPASFSSNGPLKDQ
ncbi:MAG TPA: 3-hydroxyacyl-ACP dehydratase FabZ family protein [Chthoniobacterales bacterium]|jgi:3-hydroxyacyl-[acyl-carrier-protein] dehydratase